MGRVGLIAAPSIGLALGRALIGQIGERGAHLGQEATDPPRMFQVGLEISLKESEPTPGRRQRQPALLKCVAQRLDVAREAIAKLRSGVPGPGDFVQDGDVVDRWPELAA